MSEDGEATEMDPLTIGASVAGTAAKGAAKSGVVRELVLRVLGPPADEVGKAFGRVAEYRLRNVGRIVEKTQPKIRGDAAEFPHPRTTHRILEDGSWCDDELMAEYLSGVLAAGRSPDGRDDRGTSWASLITSMSAAEVRLHFLLYGAFARLLAGVEPVVDLWVDRNRSLAQLHAEQFSLAELLAPDSERTEQFELLRHAITGLERRGLIGPRPAWGSSTWVAQDDAAFDHVVIVTVSISGIELFGWALGDSSLDPEGFVAGDLPLNTDELPFLNRIAIPNLSIEAQ